MYEPQPIPLGLTSTLDLLSRARRGEAAEARLAVVAVRRRWPVPVFITTALASRTVRLPDCCSSPAPAS